MLSVLRLACYKSHDTIFRSTINVSRQYAFKSDLKIKWVRPEKIPCIDPVKSGDRETAEFPKLDQFPLMYNDSEEFKKSDEFVKNMFTLNNSRRCFTTEVVRKNIVERVRRHNYDQRSMETKIAAMTGRIRCLQEIIKENPQDGKCKAFMKEHIDKRKKFLKYLRRWDYKRFEWILEKLNIEYKPPPNEFGQITRKASLRKLTDKYCEDLKSERLEAYERILKSQQEDFLKKKISMMEHIRQEQTECGVNVTVNLDDIKLVKAQYENFIKQKQLTN